MEQQGPIQLTTKNPKKVEMGKKLAEYNRNNNNKLYTSFNTSIHTLTLKIYV